MKIFVIYDHASAPASAHHKLAITLPAKWLELSVDKAASRPGRHSRRASGQADQKPCAQVPTQRRKA